jgi:hypothetical protein
MRIFASFPNGSIKMKRVGLVWDTLNDLNKSENLYSDVREEIIIIIDTLKPLPNPGHIRASGICPKQTLK